MAWEQAFVSCQVMIHSMKFSEEQIIQLAPDASSVKAGQQLASISKWVARHVHEKALWGNCQGSGKTPYRTMIDLGTIAFKCSCPSRKFPCKHGLGLLLLYTRSPAAFTTEAEISSDVDEWLTKREAKAAPKENKEKQITDTKAQEKRIEERERKVEGGLEEVRMWLKDLLRNGIMQVPQNMYTFNKSIIARMVDAQAPGIAGMLRRLSEINYFEEGWQTSFLRKISAIYLLTEAYKRIGEEGLPAEDIRSLIGWNTPREKVLEAELIKDHWLVLARTQAVEDRLTVERIWLYGEKTHRFALLLNFYAAGQIPQLSCVEGTAMEGSLAFYPSAWPLRALIAEQQEMKPITEPPISNSFCQLEEQLSHTLSALPFVEQIPFMLGKVRVFFQKNAWFMADSSNKTLPLLNEESDNWKVLSVTGGQEFTAFVLYEPAGVKLQAFWFNSQFYSLP